MNDIIAMEGLIKILRQSRDARKLEKKTGKTPISSNNKTKHSNSKDISLNEFRSEYKPILIKIINYLKSEFNKLSKKYPEVKYVYTVEEYAENKNFFNFDIVEDNIAINIIYYDVDNIRNYKSNIDIHDYVNSDRCEYLEYAVDNVATSAVKKYGIDNMQIDYYGDWSCGPYILKFSNISCTELKKK